MIFITECRCFDDLHTNNRRTLPNYVSIYQVKKMAKQAVVIHIFYSRGIDL